MGLYRAASKGVQRRLRQPLLTILTCSVLFGCSRGRIILEKNILGTLQDLGDLSSVSDSATNFLCNAKPFNLFAHL